uniref:Uncharacterized protein n=1 Tax=Scleropages formosus TaxID=113540 RepID=A0A8C9TW88_SCLFO
MATVDRKLPSPDAFLYKPWSAYTDAARSYCCDNMRVFGQCPAHDDFYLVVCNICNQVVKPQGFEMHYGKSCEGPRRSVPQLMSSLCSV